MTGFGRAAAELDDLKAVVELKSVNSRFCEVSIRAPRNLGRWETEMQGRIKKAFARGRVSVSVQFDGDPAGADISLNREAIRRYARTLKELRKVAGIKDAVRLEHILSFGDVFEREGDSEAREQLTWKVVAAALDAAIDGLKTMRLKEGSALVDDLKGRLDTIETALGEVDRLAPDRIVRARERMMERLGDVLGSDRIDHDRLEMEISLIADKLDVNEEAVRLRSHISQFREALQTSEPVGRKLTFLHQEMNREVNTIGAKSNDADMTRVVVSMKEQLEKVREQVENVQ